MGGDNTDRDGVLVITLEPFLHGCEWYAHMEGFRNRSMSIMSREDVDERYIKLTANGSMALLCFGRFRSG